MNYIYKNGSIKSFQVLKSFSANDITILRKFYVVYDRPKLEYNTPIWSPYLSKDINQLESV